MSRVSAIPLEHRPMLRTAAMLLADEFEGTFSTETIELFLATSYDQFAGSARVVNFLPLLAERFARQRLKALARVEGKAGDGIPVVLFLCVHNAGRSQMALGWFNHLAGGRAVAWSGGSEPGSEVNPAAVAAMAEVGIDISEEFPKPWTEEIVQAADVVVTMGCGDACPLFPGKRYEDWVLSDPSARASRRCARSETRSVGASASSLPPRSASQWSELNAVRSVVRHYWLADREAAGHQPGDGGQHEDEDDEREGCPPGPVDCRRERLAGIPEDLGRQRGVGALEEVAVRLGHGANGEEQRCRLSGGSGDGKEGAADDARKRRR